MAGTGNLERQPHFVREPSELSDEMGIAIWAPHPDDEIIGCHSVLETAKTHVTVYYGRMEDACSTVERVFHRQIRKFEYARQWAWDTVYAPDPAADLHPDHQWMGHLAQRYFRIGRIKRLIHYTVTMNAPYIFEVYSPQSKREALEQCYPDKADLWKYEHKYFLFEGYVEWLRLMHD